MMDGAGIEAKLSAVVARPTAARAAVGDVIIGQDEVIEQSLAAILSGGHALLTGVPGLGKTKLVDTLGTVMGFEHKRVQCTPDLMPADIIGSEILGGERLYGHKGSLCFQSVYNIPL